jgi:hypothetical protein
MACRCGGLMEPALRYEATATVLVAVCWQCGAEDPPLYQRTALQRNGMPFDQESVCPRCAKPFMRASSRVDKQRHCSLRCQRLAASAQVRNPIWLRRSA